MARRRREMARVPRPKTEDEGDDAEGERAIVADLVWAACGEVVDASRDPALRDLSRCGGLVRGGFPVLVEENDAPNAEADESPAGAASPAALGSLGWPGCASISSERTRR